MGVIVRMEASSFRPVDEGEYVVELAAVESRDGKFGPALDFRFRIVDGEFANTEVTGLVSASLQPGNKLDKYLRALGINTLEVGQELDVESLVGSRAHAYVTPTPGKKEGQVFNNVSNIRPFKGNRAAAPTASATQAAPALKSAAAPKTGTPSTDDAIQW